MVTISKLPGYVDDILIFSKEPHGLIKRLQVTYPLQGVGIPQYYLGGDFKVQKQHREVGTFTFCAKTYLVNVCEKIERLMGVVLMCFETPMTTGNHLRWTIPDYSTMMNIKYTECLLGAVNGPLHWGDLMKGLQSKPWQDSQRPLSRDILGKC